MANIYDPTALPPGIPLGPPGGTPLGMAPTYPYGDPSTFAPPDVPAAPPLDLSVREGDVSPPPPPLKVTPDVIAAVKTVWSEARGESPQGRQAVAGVIMNRALRTGQPISKIVTQHGQFSGVGNPAYNSLEVGSPQFNQLLGQITPVLQGRLDPSGGADSYYAPQGMPKDAKGIPLKPHWDDGTGQQIGNQLFFKGKYGDYVPGGTTVESTRGSLVRPVQLQNISRWTHAAPPAPAAPAPSPLMGGAELAAGLAAGPLGWTALATQAGMNTGVGRALSGSAAASTLQAIPGMIAAREQDVAQQLAGGDPSSFYSPFAPPAWTDPRVSELATQVGTPEVEHPTHQFSAPVRAALTPSIQAAQALLPKNPNWAEKTAEAVGGLAPYVATSLVPGGEAAAFELMRGQTYEDTYQEALQHGASDTDAMDAANAASLLSAGIGAVPLGGLAEKGGAALLQRFAPKALAKITAQPLAALGASTAVHSLAGGIQMGAMPLSGNIVAQQTYDPTRPTWQGVPEAALAGGLLTGIPHAVMSAPGAILEAKVNSGAARTAARLGDAGQPPPQPGPVIIPRRPPPTTPMPESDALNAAQAMMPPAPPEPTHTQVGTMPSGAPIMAPTPEPPPGGEPPPPGGGVMVDPNFVPPARGPDGVPISAGGVAVPDELGGTRIGGRRGPSAGVQTFIPGPQGGVPTEPLAPPPTRPATPRAGQLTPDINQQIGALTRDTHPDDLTNAAGDVQTWRAPLGPSLLQAIKANGGIRPRTATGEAIPVDVRGALNERGVPPGFWNGKGMGAEDMAQALAEQGWFGAHPADPTNAMLDALSNRGSTYHPDVAPPSVLAHREALDNEMLAAGVSTVDHPAFATAKLAAYRDATRPPDDALVARADELGVPYADTTTHRDLLGDVLEREAIMGENDEGYDRIERENDDGLHPADRSAEWARATPPWDEGAEAGAEPSAPAAVGAEPRAPPEGRAPVEAQGPGERDQGAEGGGGGAAAPAEGRVERPADYGAGNKLVTTDEANAIRARMLARRAAQAAAGVPREEAPPAAEPPTPPTDRIEWPNKPPHLVAALNEADRAHLAAEAKYQPVADAYRNRQIGDEEYLAARKERDAALEAYNRAEAAVRDAPDVAPPTETTRLGGETVEQGLFPGGEASAKQAAQARGETLKPRAPQAEPGGLFAPPEVPEPDMFAAQPAAAEAGVPKEEGPPQPAAAPAASPWASAKQLAEMVAARNVTSDHVNAIEQQIKKAALDQVQKKVKHPRPYLQSPGTTGWRKQDQAVYEHELAAASVKRKPELDALNAKLTRQQAAIAEASPKAGQTVHWTDAKGAERQGEATGRFEDQWVVKQPSGFESGHEASELKPGPHPQPDRVMVQEPMFLPNGRMNPRALADKPLVEPAAEPTPPAPAEPGAAPPARPAGYGANNKLVTTEEADAIRARMRAKMRNQLSAGVDPELMMDGARLAVYHLESGARSFADFAREMLSDLGEWARPYLHSWYEGARHYPGNEEAATQMTPPGEVKGVLDQLPHPERTGQEPAPEDQPRPPAVSPEPGGAQRGPGAGGAEAPEGRLPQPGGGGVPGGRPAAVGEPGDQQVPGAAPGAGAGAAEPGERGGSDKLGDLGVQPDRTRPGTAEDATRTAAHVEPQGAVPTDPANVSVDAPPVPVELDDALPDLFPEQRGDVAFAERRFAQDDGHGVLFTNGTGSGKTFTAGGIIKRFHDAGKRNILIVAPSDGIMQQWGKTLLSLLGRTPMSQASEVERWSEALRNMGIEAKILGSTREHGDHGVTLTTYANLGANHHLGQRAWDLVVADEAHTLMSKADGAVTQALRHLRAITGHPLGARTWADMQFPDEARRVAELDAGAQDAKGPQKRMYEAAYKQARAALDAKAAPHIEQFNQTPRTTKTVFLSATPFAYDKNVDYGSGYLFDYPPDPVAPGYNDPKTGKDQFFIQHFGYGMRTGKLTRPDNAVQSEIMERAFHEWLRSRQVLSGRVLNVDKDYDRRFQTVESGVGRKIDQATDFLWNGQDGAFRELGGQLLDGFDYLKRERLLEALKAEAAIPVIQQHLALGRKVAIYHRFNEGGGVSPFAWNDEHEDYAKRQEKQDYPYIARTPLGDRTRADPFATKYGGGRVAEGHGFETAEARDNFMRDAGLADKHRKLTLREAYQRFIEANPYVDQMNADWANLKSPIERLTQAFPNAVVYNGKITQRVRNAGQKAFNTDGSGRDVMIVQADAGSAGLSLHDTTGVHQRAILNIGMMGKPTQNLQIEGRIYRIGQASNALFRYLTTDTNWERRTFSRSIAEKSGTTENLALGNLARSIRDSFIRAYEEADAYPPHAEEGVGGKENDRNLTRPISNFERAKSYYFAQQKKGAGRANREGVDYFATPEPIGQKMVEWANLKVGEHALEPSAGHGAIARWLPETVSRTLIEPSPELATRAGLAAPGSRLIEGRFQDLHVNNKYDGIVMNPPFGVGGRTAMEHLDLAASHLRNGGRIVALIPRGPAADARYEAWKQSDGAKDLHQVAEVELPSSVFERAGTKALTRIVVLDKHAGHPEIAGELGHVHMVMPPDSNISELFDHIENEQVPDRVPPRVKETAAAPEGAVEQFGQDAEPTPPGEKAAKPPLEAVDHTDGTFHALGTKRVSNDVWRSRNVTARSYGGEFLKGSGWRFATPEARDAFVRHVTTGEATPEQQQTPQAFKSSEYQGQHVAQPTERTDSDVWKERNATAKRHGGQYQRAGTAAPFGWHFPTAEKRDAFVQEASGGADRKLAQVNPTRRGFMAGAAAAPLAVRARAATPLHDSVEAMARQPDAKAADVAGMIARTSKNPAYRTLGEKLGRLLGDAKVRVADQEGELDDLGDTLTFDDEGRRTGDITLYHSTSDPKQTGLTEETALHEMLHSAVVQRYGTISRYLGQNRELVGDKTQRAGDEAITDFRSLWEDLTGKIAAREAKGEKVVPDELKDDPSYEEFTRSPDEAMSWAMTNPKLQAFLKTIDVNGEKITDPGRTSVWSKLVDFVRKLVGLGPDFPKTALDKIMDAGHSVLDRAQLDQPDRKFANEIRDEAGREGLRQRARSQAGVPPPTTPPAAAPAKREGVIERLMAKPDDLFAKAKPHLDRIFPDTSKDSWRTFPHDLVGAFAPLARGAATARAGIKSFANLMRETTFSGANTDAWLVKNFTRQQHELMYDALEEESLAAVQGRTLAPGEGLDRLSEEERDAVEKLVARSNRVWNTLKTLGVVKDDGLPHYVPRMLVALNQLGELEALRGKGGPKTTAEVGSNLQTWGGHLMERKGETISDTEELARQINPTAKVVRNIRTLNLATTRSERIALQRMLMDHLRSSTAGAGAPAMIDKAAEGYKTVAGHPAFKDWRPDLIPDPQTGKLRPKLDEFGKPLPDYKQLHLHQSLMPAMKAVLASRDPWFVRALSAVKAAQMNMLLFSPATHMQVVWGGAYGLAPGKMSQLWKPYVEGFKARQNPDNMREALRHGFSPPSPAGGHLPDVAGIAADRQIEPGHGFLSKTVGGAVGLANKGAGQAVSRKMDAVGHFLHNTMLWDRIADLQMGIYVNIRDKEIARGTLPETAKYMAAHLANRAVGMIPPETMSALSRTASNMVFFARNFTLNNLARLKDVVRGLPGEVQAQIKAEDGAAALRRAQGVVRTRAVGALAIDYAMAHLMAATLAAVGQGLAHAIIGQDDDAKLTLDPTMTKAAHLAAPALGAVFGQGAHDYLAGAEANEPGKEDHVFLYRKPDGTNVYLRNPAGHTEQDLWNWITKTGPTFRSKESPVAGWLDAYIHNDKGFKKPLYDETPTHGPVQWAGQAASNGAAIGWDLIRRSVPIGMFDALRDMVFDSGDGRGAGALKAALGLMGFTASQGYPGGTEAATDAQQRQGYDYKFAQAKPHAAELLVQARRAMDAGNEARSDALRQQADDWLTAHDVIGSDAIHYENSFFGEGPSKGATKRSQKISAAAARQEAGVPAY